jgi:NTP pyrophosphatase (non-canonical NTP hydrolase)
MSVEEIKQNALDVIFHFDIKEAGEVAEAVRVVEKRT